MTEDPLMARGLDAFDQGHYDVAANCFEHVLSTDSDNAEACLLLGSIYGEQGDFDKACSLLVRATELDPLDLSTHLTLGHLYRMRGDLGSALQSFRKAVALDGQDFEALCACVGVLTMTGQDREAMALLESAIAGGAAGPELLNMAGALAARLSNPGAALEFFSGALRLVPDSIEARLGMSGALIDLQRYDDAERLLESLQRTGKGNPEVATKLSGIRILQGRLYEAVELAGQAVHSDPGNSEYLVRYAEALERRGDVDTAFDVLRPLLEADRPPVGAVIVFARICVSLGMRDDGLYLLQGLRERELSGSQRKILQELEQALLMSGP